MSIQQLFLREVSGEHGLIVIALLQDAPCVCVRSGPFVLEIDVADLRQVITTLSFVLHAGGNAAPIRTKDGNYLNISLGAADCQHLWISSGNAHFRFGVVVANAVLGALSEASRHISLQGGSMFSPLGGATC
jgi:hypothetical protein